MRSSHPPSSGTRRSSLPPPYQPWNTPELLQHAELLADSHERLVGNRLLLPGPRLDRARALFEAPFVVVSHGTELDPLFNYGNRKALELWEMTWDEFIGSPSRHSAQPDQREERDRLLQSVAQQGCAKGYSGIRISKSGRRFRIEDVTVFNLIDTKGEHRGQAATYSRWTYL